MGEISLELGGSSEPYLCPCCNQVSQTIWGFVYEDGDAHAVYYAGWTLGHKHEGVTIAIGLGEWGDDTGPEGRYSVGLEARTTDSDILFAVIDPDRSPWGNTEFIGRMLSRDEAL